MHKPICDSQHIFFELQTLCSSTMWLTVNPKKGLAKIVWLVFHSLSFKFVYQLLGRFCWFLGFVAKGLKYNIFKKITLWIQQRSLLNVILKNNRNSNHLPLLFGWGFACKSSCLHGSISRCSFRSSPQNFTYKLLAFTLKNRWIKMSWKIE